MCTRLGLLHMGTSWCVLTGGSGNTHDRPPSERKKRGLDISALDSPSPRWIPWQSVFENDPNGPFEVSFFKST